MKHIIAFRIYAIRNSSHPCQDSKAFGVLRLRKIIQSGPAFIVSCIQLFRRSNKDRVKIRLEIPVEDRMHQDCTTILNGYYADASRMFVIGKTTPQKEKLVRVAKECLEIGMKAAQPFGFVGDIGHAIEKHAKKNGFSVVRDLCGHGVGVEFHEEPDVEHFGKKGTGMLLVPGMVFTIEPMINMGTWEVFIDEEDGWTVVTEDELPSAQWEHTFVMTEHGVEILTH